MRATSVSVSGLEHLSRLESLEYLSLGGFAGEESKFTGEVVIPILNSIPSLKKVWLDGVSLTQAQKEMLASRYEYFRN